MAHVFDATWDVIAQVMEDTIASAVAGQRERWTAVSTLLTHHVAQKESDLAALRQQSAVLTAQLTEFTADVASALDGTNAAAGGALQACTSCAISYYIPKGYHLNYAAVVMATL